MEQQGSQHPQLVDLYLVNLTKIAIGLFKLNIPGIGPKDDFAIFLYRVYVPLTQYGKIQEELQKIKENEGK